MMLTTLEQAEAIASDLDPLDDGLYSITLDQSDVGPAIAAGRVAILITAPTIEHPDQHHAILTWTLIVISYAADKTDAWRRLDTATQAIAAAMEAWPERVEPIDWTDISGRLLPGLSLSYTQHLDH